MSKSNIPSFFEKLFEWCCKPELYEELQGDLEEAFEVNVKTHGLRKARAIYRKEVLKMMRPSVFRYWRFSSNLSRLSKNYFKTSVRSFKLNPYYITANVLGMAVALSIATVAYFTNQYVVNFNHSYEQASNLYKVHGSRATQSSVGASVASLAPRLRAEDVEAMRYTSKNVNIRLGKRLFQDPVAFADPGFFKYFPFDNLEGKPVQSPKNSEIAISKSTAIKLFDEPYPVGELVNMVFPNLEEHSFIVSDVFEDLSSPISFDHDIIMSMDQYFTLYGIRENDWEAWVDATFVFARPNELEGVELRLESYLSLQNSANAELEIDAYQLDDILIWPGIEGDLYKRAFKSNLANFRTSPMIMAAAILLLACFNFINTSIALSGKRLKEIAIRKVLGGNRMSTITQFMMENALLIASAVLISAGVSHFLISAWNTLFGYQIIDVANIQLSSTLGLALVLTLIVALLSGAYPALYVSKFKPLIIFRDKVVLSGKNNVMSGLLIFQFSLCFFTLFGSFYNVDNSKFQETYDRGYNIDHVVNIPIKRPEQFDVLRNQLKGQSGVQGVAGSADLVGFSYEEAFAQHEGVEHPIAILNVGAEYPEVMKLRLAQGNQFSQTAFTGKEILVNEMFGRTLDMDVLNKQVSINNTKYKVIGVLDDFNIEPFYNDSKIEPTVIRVIPPTKYSHAVVRMAGVEEENWDVLEGVWYGAFSQELYVGFPQEKAMEYTSRSNYMMIRVGLFLGLISVLISIVGLYTLIALTIQRRSKEFGIRKVLGASRLIVIQLVGRRLYWILGLSGAIGLTFAYIQNRAYYPTIYAYYQDVSVVHFLGPIVSLVLIVTVTLGYKVIQTGRLNPVSQLRTE